MILSENEKREFGRAWIISALALAVAYFILCGDFVPPDTFRQITSILERARFERIIGEQLLVLGVADRPITLFVLISPFLIILSFFMVLITRKQSVKDIAAKQDPDVFKNRRIVSLFLPIAFCLYIADIFLGLPVATGVMGIAQLYTTPALLAYEILISPILIFALSVSSRVPHSSAEADGTS